MQSPLTRHLKYAFQQPKLDLAKNLPSYYPIGIQEVTTTVKNPRANAILERVHGVIGDML
jgi:hypothetical protein